MELYLIRHAQSLNNALPVEQRMEDPPLTALGFQQAEEVANWIQQKEIDRLFTSPFLRTLQTADAIRQTLGLIPEVWIELHEQGGCQRGDDLLRSEGRPGMTAQEIVNSFPGTILPNEIDHTGWWKCKPCETLDEAIERAQFVAAVMKRDFGPIPASIAVVSHGAFKQLLIAALLNMSIFEGTWAGSIHNSAVTHLSVTEDRAILRDYNSTVHLAPELVT